MVQQAQYALYSNTSIQSHNIRSYISLHSLTLYNAGSHKPCIIRRTIRYNYCKGQLLIILMSSIQTYSQKMGHHCKVTLLVKVKVLQRCAYNMQMVLYRSDSKLYALCYFYLFHLIVLACVDQTLLLNVKTSLSLVLSPRLCAQPNSEH